MAGFVLGTGSGVLAAAMVYYTISTSVSSSTAVVQSKLHTSSDLLHTSFDPTTPHATSSLIGPSSPSQQPFTDLLRQRWNVAVGRAVHTARTTEWSAIGQSVYDSGRTVAGTLGAKLEEEKVGERLRQGAATGLENVERAGVVVSDGLRDMAERTVDEVGRAAQVAREEMGRAAEIFKEEVGKAREGVKEGADTVRRTAGDLGALVKQEAGEIQRAKERSITAPDGMMGEGQPTLREEQVIGGQVREVKAKKDLDKARGRLV